MAEKVLLADFLDTAVMVSPDVQLHIFRYNQGVWKYWKTFHPTLKESQLVKVVEESEGEYGYFKIEVRNPSTNRPVFPNVLYVVVDRNGVQNWDTKPLEEENESKEDTEIVEELQTHQNTDLSALVKATLEPITQMITAQMQQTNQLLTLLLNQKKEEDPFREFMRLKVEKEKIRLLRELSDEDNEESEGIWENATLEEKQLANQIIVAYQQGNISTAITLWNQLREKNEKLAEFLLSYAIDEALKGNFPFWEDNNAQKQNTEQ